MVEVSSSNDDSLLHGWWGPIFQRNLLALCSEQLMIQAKFSSKQLVTIYHTTDHR